MSCIHPYGHMGFHLSCISFLFHKHTHIHTLATHFFPRSCYRISEPGRVSTFCQAPPSLFSSSVPCSVRPNYCLMNQWLFTSSWGIRPSPPPPQNAYIRILVQSAMHHHSLVNLKHLNYHITLHCTCFSIIYLFFLTLEVFLFY